jgi:hypothetical protein
MSIVAFDLLPDSARLWVFASDKALSGAAADTLLAAVDRFLADWKAHGVPLRSARDWRDGRFLAIGVDVTAENASGCSIDGLFRTLQQIEREVGARLVGGGRVFYRTKSGIETATRDEFAERVTRGDVAWETPVFDISVAEAAGWRSRFETPAGTGWTAGFFRGRETGEKGRGSA